MTYCFAFFNRVGSYDLYSFETTDRATAIATLHSVLKAYSDVAVSVTGLRGHQIAMDFGKGSFWQRRYLEE